MSITVQFIIVCDNSSPVSLLFPLFCFWIAVAHLRNHRAPWQGRATPRPLPRLSPAAACARPPDGRLPGVPRQGHTAMACRARGVGLFPECYRGPPMALLVGG